MAGLKLPTLSPALMARLEEVLGTLKGLPVVQALKGEGVPGLYFQRAGRRSDGKLPDTFNTDNHNFVIFDQDKVNINDVQNKQRGGSVC
jgi:hypothetical protein